MLSQRERREEIYRCKSHMSEELERATRLKEACSFDDIGVKLTCLTREKLFRQGLYMFKLMKHRNKELLKKELVVFYKRKTLHIYQLKKLGETLPSVEDNISYFNLISGLVLMYIKMIG